MDVEALVSWIVIFVAGAFFVRAVRRHRAKPQLRMWNPYDPADVRPGEPMLGPNAVNAVLWVAGFLGSVYLFTWLAQ